jgi:beta-lactamase class A
MLVDWMLGNTTGATRIRAGVPAGWRVADKTGSGSYGSTNTVALLYPPGKPPMTMAVYFTQPRQDADARSEVVAAAAKVVAEIV